MKILLVITKSEIGGAQNFVLALARGLKTRGHEVTLAGGTGDYLPAIAKADGLEFVRFASLRRSRNPWQLWQFKRELQRFLKTRVFDIVHLNSSNALAGASALDGLKVRPKLVFTVHGLSVLDPGHKAPKILKILYRLWFKSYLHKVDKAVFVSQHNLDQALDYGLAEDGERIYNGVDGRQLDFLDREAARHELGRLVKADLSDVYLVGSIGRLAYPKNYEFLIALWPALLKERPEARLLIIGEGPERSKYEALIAKLNLRNYVWLPGAQARAGRYLKAFDCFVLPSLYEGLALTVIEAGIAGCPILASAVGGLPEILGPSELFRLDDQPDFLEKIKKGPAIVRTPEAWQEQFGAGLMVEKYLNLYKKLVNLQS